MGNTVLVSKYSKGVHQTKAFLVRKRSFDLHAGGKSHVYLNHRNFLTEGKYLSLVANGFADLINEKILEADYQLCSIDSTMSPIISGALSEITNKDILVVREKKIGHGTKEDIYGIISNKKECIIIDDVVSTGTLIINAANKIRANGGRVKYAVVCAYRNIDVINLLKENGIELVSITNYKEIIMKLKSSLSKEEFMIAINDQTIY